MRAYIILLLLLFAGCTGASETEKECLFQFSSSVNCKLNNLDVVLISEKVANDEKNLKTLKVKSNGHDFILNISKDTSMLDGDKGLIVLQDINFDSYPDIAISTSFGASNLYMDYWIYDKGKNKFRYLGNFSRFTINKKDKSLSNTVKINAANYRKSVYRWSGTTLVKNK